MALGTRCLTWYEGAWHDGNHPILGAADHGTWQGDLVFDGARFFEGTTPISTCMPPGSCARRRSWASPRPSPPPRSRR